MRVRVALGNASLGFLLAGLACATGPRGCRAILSTGVRAPELVAFDRAIGARFWLDSSAIVVAAEPLRGLSRLGATLAADASAAALLALDPPGLERRYRGAWLVRGRANSYLDRLIWRPERGGPADGSPSDGGPENGSWERALRIRLPFTAGAVAATERGVWVGASRGFDLRLIDHAGTQLLACSAVDADGVEALLPASERAGGGVWAAAGGAILRFDAKGRRRPGQGGFAHVIGLTGAR